MWHDARIIVCRATWPSTGRSFLKEDIGEHVTREQDSDGAKKEQHNIVVICPYCASTDTELYSLFGQQLLTVQYYCNACHTPFEHVKDDDVLYEHTTLKEEE